MAVFRVEKTKDYTVMSNFHLRDKSLTLKAKGLLSLMLSLPDTWDYTLQGLAHICKDGIDSVRSGITEIENAGYLTRRRLRGENGQLGDIEYTILEKPHKPDCYVDNSQPTSEKPTSVSPTLENPIQAKPMQEKTTQSSIKSNQELKEINTHGLNIHQSIQDAGSSSKRSLRPDRPEAEFSTTTRSKEIDTMDRIDIYRDIIKENIDYDCLRERFKYSTEQIDEIVELMTETVCSNRRTIRISGEDKPAELVKSRFLKIDFSHIEYSDKINIPTYTDKAA